MPLVDEGPVLVEEGTPELGPPEALPLGVPGDVAEPGDGVGCTECRLVTGGGGGVVGGRPRWAVSTATAAAIAASRTAIAIFTAVLIPVSQLPTRCPDGVARGADTGSVVPSAADPNAAAAASRPATSCGSGIACAADITRATGSSGAARPARMSSACRRVIQRAMSATPAQGGADVVFCGAQPLREIAQPAM